MRFILAVLTLVSATSALASDGPWVTSQGATSLYGGSEYERWRYFRTSGNRIDMETPVIATRAFGVMARGIAPGLEAELILPLERVTAASPDSAKCVKEGRPEDWCAPTTGVGSAMFTLKARLLDEYEYRPFSLSVSATLRVGEFHSQTRGRLTNIGDGQSDIATSIAAGRKVGVGKGYVGAYGISTYWLRFGHDGRMFHQDKIPADALGASGEVFWAPHGRAQVGFAAYYYSKLWGDESISDARLNEVNGFAALRSTQLKAGVKAIIPAGGQTSIVMSAMVPAYANNAPVDSVVIAIGLGHYIPNSLLN